MEFGPVMFGKDEIVSLYTQFCAALGRDISEVACR